jgi:hypothetical protein
MRERATWLRARSLGTGSASNSDHVSVSEARFRAAAAPHFQARCLRMIGIRPASWPAGRA